MNFVTIISSSSDRQQKLAFLGQIKYRYGMSSIEMQVTHVFQGHNIYEGSKLLLSLLWQMMRYYTLSLMKYGESDKTLTENEVIAWCNKSDILTLKKLQFFRNFSESNTSFTIDSLFQLSRRYQQKFRVISTLIVLFLAINLIKIETCSLST